ncbi:tail fiber protein [Clostridiaceae bacterium M8S5]|nr:tail fiber protein [Clostridiaceae bacterium M8S5]
MTYKSKTNWNRNDIVSEQDLNRIEIGIEDAHEKLKNIEENTRPISDSVSYDNSETAASSKAVKTVMDKANSAFQLASDGKNKIATSITGMGQEVSGDATFDTLASKISSISNDANASVTDVISGKTFYQGGAKRKGTIVDRGSSVTITPGINQVIKPAGYYSGDITILGDNNLKPSNIKNGTSIFGVAGTVQTIKDKFLYHANSSFGSNSWVQGVYSGGANYKPTVNVGYSCLKVTTTYTWGGLASFITTNEPKFIYKNQEIIVLFTADEYNSAISICLSKNKLTEENNSGSSVIRDSFDHEIYWNRNVKDSKYLSLVYRSINIDTSGYYYINIGTDSKTTSYYSIFLI